MKPEEINVAVKILLYDAWVGFFLDRKKGVFYFFPFPCVGFIFGKWGEKKGEGNMERCNVCGRELIRNDEKSIYIYIYGCCAICANEEIPNHEEKTVGMRNGIPPLGRSLRLLLEKRAKRLRKIESRWWECGET